MSDSELSDVPTSGVPPDAVLERSLRQEVEKKFKAGQREQLTVNFIREVSEKALGLEKGFYNSHPIWKPQSKEIIKDEVEKQETAPSLPPKPSPRPPKRSSPAGDTAPKKKRKTALPHKKSNDKDNPIATSSHIISDEDEPKKKAKEASEKGIKSKKQPVKKNGVSKAASKQKPKPRKTKSSPEQSEADSDHHSVIHVAAQQETDPGEESSSALSSLVDEDPQPKERRTSKRPVEKKSKKAGKAKSRIETEEDPDTAEIKRLQGWLVKCGIRKLWGKELKPYETPKAKINHLRDMLADAGMTGRYSTEKAMQIKEARELAADIEAVKEGAERWGKDEEDAGSDAEEGSTRRLVRGAKNYDFLSSDGEETD